MTNYGLSVLYLNVINNIYITTSSKSIFTTMEIRIFQKFNPNTERGLIKSCEICQKDFGVFNREHQCKRCFRAVCAQCGTVKRDVYKPKMTKKPHRLCLMCSEQSNFIIEFISVNKLEFGSDCEISNKWHKRLSDEEKGTSVKSSQIRGTKKLTQQIFQQLWDSYNFSLREFVGLLTFSKNQNDIYMLVSQVYEEIQQRGIDEKMQFIIYMIMFLLCFSSADKCSDLLYLLHNLKKSIGDGKQLLSLYLKSLGVNQGDIKKISDYSNFKLKSYIGALSINTLTTQCSTHLITRILQKKKIDEAYMLFALVLEVNKQFVINNRSNKSECDLQILRKCKLSNLLDKYRLLVSVKSAPFINLRKNSGQAMKKKYLQAEQNSNYQLSRNNSNQDMNFVANFRKRKVSDNKDSGDDSWSNKTKSIRESSDLVEQNISPRKTQKFPNKISPSSSESSLSIKKDHAQSSISPSTFTPSEKQVLMNKLLQTNSSNSCQRCQQRARRIEQLEERLEKKDREISRLNTEIAFKSQEAQSFFQQKNRSRQESMQVSLHNEEVTKLQQQLFEKCEENQNNFKMLTKYQKEIMSLKSEIQELNTNNKLLKNRLQSASFATIPISSASRSSEKEEQLARQCQLMKRTLLQKNKQLEQLMKRNRLLSYQIQQNQKTSKSVLSVSQNSDDIFDRARKLEEENKNLWNKINDISEKCNDENKERLKACEELFEIKQMLKQSQSSRISMMSMPEYNRKPEKESKKKDEGCAIF